MVRTWKHILTKMPLNQYHNCEAKIFLIMTYEQLRSIRHILIVGLLGPGVHYLPVYWACGPSRGQGSVRGGDVFVRRDCVNE